MEKERLSLVTRKPHLSRRHLAFLFGITVACLFTITSVLKSGENNLRGQYKSAADDGALFPYINLTESVRVLCWVMTSPTNHESKAIHVKRTWGRRCNKLLLMSSVADEKVGTIALPVSEGRQSLWNKTREAFRYVYDNHVNEYDWFMKADDDTYVILENLRYFLYPYSPQFPIYFGSKFRYPEYVSQGYFSGGAGYVLSREALKRFAEKALNDTEHCSVAYETEDLEMGKCLETVNVTAGDSRDLMGRKRFLPMEPVFHLTSNPADDPDFWYKYYSYYEPHYGADCCSDLAISFHYIQGLQMYVMDYLIYVLHPYGFKFHSPELSPKKSWEEARIVPGPYPAETTTVKTSTSTAGSTTKTSSASSSALESTTSTTVNAELNNVTEFIEKLNIISSTVATPELSQIFETSSITSKHDDNNIDDIVDKILSDERFTEKLLEKIKSRQ